MRVLIQGFEGQEMSSLTRKRWLSSFWIVVATFKRSDFNVNSVLSALICVNVNCRTQMTQILCKKTVSPSGPFSRYSETSDRITRSASAEVHISTAFYGLLDHVTRHLVTQYLQHYAFTKEVILKIKSLSHWRNDLKLDCSWRNP